MGETDSNSLFIFDWKIDGENKLMKKILVIGGNGFIGKNVVDRLIEENYKVGVYDLVCGKREGVNYYTGDVINDDYFEAILLEYDIIIYLISAIMPQRSMKEPLSAYMTDIPLLIKTLEVCKKIGIKRIIYASSGGTIYGNCEIANVEDKYLSPINHYAICKLTCEKILSLYNNLYGMENMILRIANPYGKGQKLESGVGVITTFTRHALIDGRIQLYGDGGNIRDFIDIEEVSKAFQLAVEWKFIKEITPVFNVGSGKGISLIDLIQIIQNTLKSEMVIEYLPERNFDVHCNYLCMKKTKRYLGFEPDNGVKRRIEKYIRNLASEYAESK